MNAVDENDLAHVRRLGFKPVGVLFHAQHMNTTTFFDGEKNMSVFHSKPIYYETLTGAIRPISEITEHHGNREIILNKNWWKASSRYLQWLEKRQKDVGGFLQYPSPFEKSILRPEISVGLTISTFYSGGASAVDGWVRRNLASGSGTSWTSIRGGAGTDASSTDTDEAFIYIIADTSDSFWRRLQRGIFLFDTSALPDTDTIDAAVFSIRGTGKVDGLSISPNLDVYTSTPASDTALVAADYGQTGTTSQTGSPISYASFTDAGYNDFTFNSTGRGNIAKTGISKFAVKNANYDVADSAPAWISNTSSFLTCYYSEQTGTTNDPKLVVTHSSGTTDSRPNNLLLLGVS